MSPRVRLQDVAQRAGVSVSAASMALHEPPREVSAATVAKVRTAAAELGYVPDPAARALAAQAAAGRHPFRGTVAMLFNNDGEPTRTFLRALNDPTTPTNLRHRLAEFGYTVEGFLLPHNDREAAALARTLRHRGTVGLMADFSNWPYRMAFPWSDYPVVAFSPHPSQNVFASVIAHTANDVLLAVEQCRQRGYERIGFLRACWYPDWQMGFHYASEQIGGTLRGHPLTMETWDATRFLAWFDRYRPDAVIANEDVRPWLTLQEHGVQVPSEVGYCCLHVPPEKPELTGIRQLTEELETQAVALLHQQITRGLRSDAASHIHLQVSGIWNEGETLRPAVPKTIDPDPEQPESGSVRKKQRSKT